MKKDRAGPVFADAGKIVPAAVHLRTARLLRWMWCIDYMEELNAGCMSLEVIGKAIISGHCDRCGCAGVLHNTRDDTGRKLLLCNQCIEKAREKGS